MDDPVATRFRIAEIEHGGNRSTWLKTKLRKDDKVDDHDFQMVRSYFLAREVACAH